MFTEKQLIAAAKKITDKLAEAAIINHNEQFDVQSASMAFRNTREINIHHYIPKNDNDAEYYTYEFLGRQLVDTHFDLNGLAEQMLTIGFANGDISYHITPAGLTDMGFVPAEGTNLCAIANMLKPDNYKLTLTGETCTYEGEGYRDIYETENLTIFDKVIATRKIKVGSETLDAHSED